MKTIIVKVNDAVQTVAEHQVVTKDGQPTVVKAVNRVNYELVDQATGRAPDHIITKRVGKDLHVSVEENGQDSDLIIEGYYDEADSALIGLAEDGSYYYYVPDTGEVADFVTELAPGAAEGQALGGNAYPTPWWVGATDEAGFGILPWLVGLAGLGALIAALDDDDDDDYTPPPAPEAPADVHVDKAENVPPAEGDDRDSGSTVVTGTAQPNTEVVIKDKDGNIVGKGEADKDGNFTVTTDKPLAHNEKYDVIAQDKDGNQVGEKDTVIGSLADPTSPELVANEDGSITAKPGDDSVVDLTVEFVDENDQPQKVEIVKDKDGNWGPKPGTKLPEGVELNKETGEITLTPDAVKDGSEVTATNKDIFGQDSSATTNAGNDIEGPTVPASPNLEATPDGGIEMTPSKDADKATVDFTDEKDQPQKVEIEKGEDGSWGPKPGTQLPPGVTVDPETGKVTITPDAVKDETPVKAENSNEAGASSSEVTSGKDAEDTTGPNAPDLVATPDGGIEMTPSEDADKGKVEFTDEAGKDHTVEIEKGEDGSWAPKPGTELPPGVTLDKDTGKVTITPESVEDGSNVKAENSNDKGTSSSEVTAGDNDVNTDDIGPEAPDLVANTDGSVVMVPSKEADKATVEFTDENNQPQKVEIVKGEDGNWGPKPGTELPEGVTVVPENGMIVITPDAVLDGSTVKGENSNDKGTAGKEVTAGNDLEDTTGPAAPDLVATPDGGIEMTPSKDADKGKVEFTDEDGNGHTVEIEKGEDGSWAPKPGTELPPGVTVDPETGKVTIEPDAVEDGSNVKAENSNDKGTSSSEITAGNDIEDITPPAAPEIIAGEDGSVSITPDQKDAVDLTVEFTDEADKPQKVELEKGEDGKWGPKDGTELPEGVTVDPETGRVDIHYDAVKDETDVIATNKDDVGNASSSKATTSRDYINGPKVEIQTGEDGVVDVTDLDENKEVDVVVDIKDSGLKAGDKLEVTNQDGETKEVVLTEEDITNGSVTVPVKPAEHGKDTTVDVVVKDEAGKQIGSASDNAPTDFKVPGDTNGDGKPDTGPVISFPEDADENGYLNAAEDEEPKGETPVRVKLPVNTEAGDFVELVINGEKLDKPIELTADNIKDGYVDVPVKLATEVDGEVVDLDKIDVTATVKDNLGNVTPEDNKVLNIDTKVPGDVDGDGSATDPNDPSKGDPDDNDATTNNGAPIITFPEDANGDGFLNATENKQNPDSTPVRVSTPANTEDGDKVVITTNTGEKVEVTVSQADIDKGYIETEVTIPTDAEGNQTKLEVEAHVEDKAGNKSHTAKNSLDVDTRVPGDSDGDGQPDEAGKPVVEIADGNDGFINKDDLNEDGTVNTTITFPEDSGYTPGDNVVVKDQDGKVLLDRPLTAEDIADGITVPVTPAPEGKKTEVTAQVTDPAGNSSLEGKDESITDLIVPGLGDPDLAPQVTIADGDDGKINKADLNDNGEATATVKFPENAGYSAGDTVVITKPDGTTEEVTLDTDTLANGVEVTFKPLPEGETNEVKAVVKDPQDNTSGEGKDESITDLIVPGDSNADGIADTFPVVEIQDGEGEENQIDSVDLNEDGTVDAIVTLPKDVGYSVGDNIVIKDNAGNVLVDRPLEQNDLDDGITVQVTPPADGETLEVTATVTDPQDNSAEGKDTSKVGDTTPTDAPIIDILEGNDNVIDGKDLNKDGEVDVKVYLPEGTEDGDTLTVNGTDYPVTKEMVEEGSTIVSVPALAEGETLNVTATITDKAGNKSDKATDSAVFGDITAPDAPTVNIVDEAGTKGELDNEDLVDGKVQVTVGVKDTGAEEGDIVTVTNPDGSETNYKVTVDKDGNVNDITINYPKDQFPAEKEVTVTAKVTDQAGNVSEEGSDTTTSKLVEVPPVDPQSPEPEITVDLQDMIDLTDGAPAVADITGTTTNVPEGTQVTIELGVYKDGEPVEGQPTQKVIATVDADGNYELKDVDMSAFPLTDNTGDPEQDALTIGAKATVHTSGGTAEFTDSNSEIGKDGGFNGEDLDPEILSKLNEYGVTNDMSLAYGPSKTIIKTGKLPGAAVDTDANGLGYIISEDTSFTDPILFTNYDDKLILDRDLNRFGVDAGGPNDGNKDNNFGSTDNEKYHITIDTGAGNDYLQFNRIDNGATSVEPHQHHIYMGEGNDTLKTTYTGLLNSIMNNTWIYMETGDDTLISDKVSGKIYMGSGSDTIEIRQLNNNGYIDLGSGEEPEGYLYEYQDGSGRQLGTKDHADKATDHNIVKVSGALGVASDLINTPTIVSGIGSEEISADDIKANMKLSDGDVNIKSNNNIAGSVTIGDGDVTISAGDTISADITSENGTREVNAYNISGRLHFKGEGVSTIEVTNNVSSSGVIITESKNNENDTITVGNNVAGTIRTHSGDDNVTAKSVGGGYISTDEGIDTITVNGDVSGRAIIDSGADNDTIDITGYVTGSDVWGGSGDDTITVAKNNVDVSVYDSRLLGGSGDDTIEVTGNVAFNSLIDGGVGNDTITIGGSVVERSVVRGGDGNDILELGGTVSGTSSVDMGTGVDAIILTGQDQNLGLKEVFNVEYIDLTGTGNNKLTAVWKDYLARNGSGNEDGILRINGDAGDEVNLGNQTNLGDSYSDGDASWSFTGGTVKGTGEVINDLGVIYDVYQLGTSGTQVYIAHDITVI